MCVPVPTRQRTLTLTPYRSRPGVRTQTTTCGGIFGFTGLAATATAAATGSGGGANWPIPRIDAVESKKGCAVPLKFKSRKPLRNNELLVDCNLLKEHS